MDFLSAATCQDGLVAAMAAGRVLSGAALPAHDAIILGAERLLGQRLVALGTAETVLVPVAPLVAQLLVGPWGKNMGEGSRRRRSVNRLARLKGRRRRLPWTPQGLVDGTRRRCWRRTWCGSERTPACPRDGQTSSHPGPPGSRSSGRSLPSWVRRSGRHLAQQEGDRVNTYV